MSITNYWFQLIWLLTVGMVLAISLPKKQEIVMGRIEERWQIAPAVLLVVPYILAATLRSDNFGDTYAYRSVFREAPSKIAALPLYLEGIKKNKGFSVFNCDYKSSYWKFTYSVFHVHSYCANVMYGIYLSKI